MVLTEMPKVRINESFCKGCRICVEFCPMKILKTSEKMTMRGVFPPIVVDEAKCTGCRICEFYCPDFAIYVVKER